MMAEICIQETDQMTTNPKAAFTLDITSDRKVRLHLNRALITRVLKQQEILNTMPRNKPRKKVSRSL